MGRREVESCEVESSALDFNACDAALMREHHKWKTGFLITRTPLVVTCVPVLTCREGFWRALALMIGGAGQGELLTNTVSGSPGELPVSENPAGSS